MRLITYQCDGCGTQHTETHYGAGAPGWCGLKGIALEGGENDRGPEEPVFCPECKKRLIGAVDQLRTENGLD